MEVLLESGMGYAYALTHEMNEAEDLLQEACLAVVNAQGAWSRGYLFSAIRTRFLDRCRRRQVLTVELVGDLKSFVDTSADEVLGAGDLFEADHESLDRALAALSSPQREVLFLAAVEGLTAQEIADLVDRPRGTVLSLIHRARLKIRAFFSKESRKGGRTP